MPFLDLLAAICAAGVAVLALFLAHGRHGDDRGGPRAELVRYLGLAAVAALVCGVMNVLEIMGGGAVAAAVGNAANVFAPALVWAGARRLNARPAIGAVSAGAGGILMLGVTFLVSLDDATLIKTTGLVVFSVMALAELRRRPLADVGGSTIMAWTLAIYAVYNLERLVVAVVTGVGSPLWQAVASQDLTSVLSALVILAMGLGGVRMGRELDDDPAPGTRAHDRGALRREAKTMLDAHGEVDTVIARLPEMDLIRAAHHTEAADVLLSSLLDATRDALPDSVAGVPARDTVFALVPPGEEPPLVDAAVRRRFAAQMPRIGYDDTPDISFVHRRITEVDELSLLMGSRRLRPRYASSDDGARG